MSHLYILTDAETEAVNGGFFNIAGNLAFMPQSNTLFAVPVATGGLFGRGSGGEAELKVKQSNDGRIRQRTVVK